MVRQLENRRPGQGAPHQHLKKVAPRGVGVDNMVVRVGMMVGMAVMARVFLHASIPF